MKRRYLIASIILLAFGAGKLKVEQALAEEHRTAFFHGANLDLGLREQIGQLGFLAALSGFRALVADMLWLQAHTAWERTEWGRMALLLNNVVELQPRSVLFWDMAAWHMAWNASVAAMENPKEPREALRIKAQRKYFDLGKDFLMRGIRNNPDKWDLYDRLGMLYRDKYKDHCAAAESYAKAASFKEAPEFEHRFAAYELAACPGKERAAYEELRRLYLKGDQERLPTLLHLLGELQEKLDVPPDRRVYTPPENKSP